MRWHEGLRVGALEILSHKLRSFLTLFGIAIGITSVMSMTGIMSGFQIGMREGIHRMGEGRLFIWQHSTNKNRNRSSGLVYEDALAIQRNFPQLITVSPSVSMMSNLFFEDFNAKIRVSGITPQWAQLDWNYSLRGRFISELDVRNYAKVCVLVKRRKSSKKEPWRQKDPLDQLLQHHDPLNKTVRIGQTAFRVVGILEEGPRSKMMNVGFGMRNALVPISSYYKRLNGGSEAHQIDINTGDTPSSFIMAKRVFALLKRRHRGVEDFQVKNMMDMMGQAMNWINMLTFVMLGVAAIALFAGGVGIMNITLASVHARIREIGIRKSVGARERDIRLQFLLEAVALSALGGLLGIALGYGICLSIRQLADMAVLPPPIAVIASLLVSVSLGIGFSWYPARQASQLDPIEALRYE